MLSSSLTVLAIIGSMQTVGPPSPEVQTRRILIIGATVITAVENGVAEVFPDATIAIEGGRVVAVGARIDFQLREDDIAVTARDRFAIAAPILFGKEERWLRGTSLLEAAVSGVGFIAMPEEELATPHGRCATFRVAAREFPAAMPIKGTGGGVVLSPSDEARPGVTLQMRLAEVVHAKEQGGASGTEVLEAFYAASSREDLGVIRPGSVASILITNGDPRANVTTLFEPHAFVMGDRVMRRAEIETMRDTLVRSRAQRTAAASLTPPGTGGRVHRYLVSVGGQLFGGAAVRVEGDRVSFVTKQGAPRNDSIHGTLLREGIVGSIVYDGPPESFTFKAKAMDGGLSIKLHIDGREPVQAASPGATAPPLIELAADLAIRAAALSAGAREFAVQELIYGNGPIGLGPRKLRFTPIPSEACPPCFETQADVWKLEVFDLEATGEDARFHVFVAMRDGAATRIRIDTPYGASWYDVLDGSPTLD